MAGHSLGEIAALVAADAISAEDGLRLVAARGRLMQEAAEETGDGGMIAVRARGDRAPIHEVAEATGLSVANDNAPDQLVLSGATAALDEAEAALSERKVRGEAAAGSGRLPLAADGARRGALPRDRRRDRDRPPSVPVYSCVTAEPFDDIPARLVEAITSPVRWLDVMHALERRGARRFVETGPGRVLTNLVRKSLDGVEAEAPLAEATEAAHA